MASQQQMLSYEPAMNGSSILRMGQKLSSLTPRRHSIVSLWNVYLLMDTLVSWFPFDPSLANHIKDFTSKAWKQMASTPMLLQQCSIRGVKINSPGHFSVTTSSQLLWLQSFHYVDIISPIVWAQRKHSLIPGSHQVWVELILHDWNLDWVHFEHFNVGLHLLSSAFFLSKVATLTVSANSLPRA